MICFGVLSRVRCSIDNTSRWYANIKVNKENIRLGSFVTKEEAIEARREAEIKYFGEYAFQTGNEMVPRVERTKKSEAA